MEEKNKGVRKGRKEKLGGGGGGGGGERRFKKRGGEKEETRKGREGEGK